MYRRVNRHRNSDASFRLQYESLESRLLLASDLLTAFDTRVPLSSRPAEFLATGDHVFFQASFSSGGGTQLWRTDGTAAGTIPLVTDQPGLIREYADVNEKYVFSSADGTVRASDGAESVVLIAEASLDQRSFDAGPTRLVSSFAGVRPCCRCWPLVNSGCQQVFTPQHRLTRHHVSSSSNPVPRCELPPHYAGRRATKAVPRPRALRTIYQRA